MILILISIISLQFFRVSAVQRRATLRAESPAQSESVRRALHTAVKISGGAAAPVQPPQEYEGSQSY